VEGVLGSSSSFVESGPELGVESSSDESGPELGVESSSDEFPPLMLVLLLMQDAVTAETVSNANGYKEAFEAMVAVRA
jgi:hypothetical protein